MVLYFTLSNIQAAPPPTPQMHNRMVALLCNLKPVTIGGVVSQAAVMCASSSGKVEILDAPSGAIFEAYPQKWFL